MSSGGSSVKGYTENYHFAMYTNVLILSNSVENYNNNVIVIVFQFRVPKNISKVLTFCITTCLVILH